MYVLSFWLQNLAFHGPTLDLGGDELLQSLLTSCGTCPASVSTGSTGDPKAVLGSPNFSQGALGDVPAQPFGSLSDS